MLKKIALALSLAVFPALGGCGHGGGDVIHRGWKHIEWHLLGAYKDLTNLHIDIDRYVFNLDVRNPDRY